MKTLLEARVRIVDKGTLFLQKSFFLTPYIFFAIIVVVLFGSSLWLPSTEILNSGDPGRYDFFIFSYVKDRFSHGEFPLWMPHIFAGYPLEANPFMNLFYPPKWLFILLPFQIALSWNMAFHVFLSMAGMYYLMRKFVHPFPAILSAITFGLCGRTMGFIYGANYYITAATAYFPLTLRAFLDVYSKPNRKTFIKAFIITTLQLVSGYQTMVMFSFEIVGVVTFVYMFAKRTIKPLFYAVVIGGISLCLAAAQLLPMQEMVRLSIRSYTKNGNFSFMGSFPLEGLILYFLPFHFGDVKSYVFGGIGYWEHAPYVGVIPLLLAIGTPILFVVFLLLFRKNNAKLSFPWYFIVSLWILTVFGLWVSFGNHASINLQQLLIDYLPMYQFIRIPPRHLQITSFALACLAGIGGEIFLLLCNQKRHILVWVLLSVTLIDLLWFANHFFTIQPSPSLRQDKKLITVLRQKTYPPDRFLENTPWGYYDRVGVDENAAMQYGLFNLNGWDISPIRHFYSFINAINNIDDLLLDDKIVVDPTSINAPFLNLRYYAVAYANTTLTNRFATSPYKRIQQNADRAYSLYEYDHPLPRFFVVPEKLITANEKDAFQRIREGTDLSKKVIFIQSSTAIPPSTCTDTLLHSVDIKSYQSNSITLSTDTPCDGYLVSSEVMYPGWKATIDGKKVDVFEGNLAFRTLFLPKGIHIVRYYFQPDIVFLGIAISIVTLIGILVFLFYGNTLMKKIKRSS